MKGVIWSVTIVITVLFISSCSSTQNYYLDPAYQKEKSSESVLVVPVQKKWFQNAFHHNFGHLSGRDQSMFYAMISPLFNEYAATTINIVSFEQEIDESNFTFNRFPVREHVTDFVVPKEDARFPKATGNYRFVLLLDEYFFSKRTKKSSTSTYAGHRGEDQLLYIFQTKYLYWDTKRKEAVAWGVVQSDLPYKDNLGFPDYSQLLSRAIGQIIQNGPVRQTGS